MSFGMSSRAGVVQVQEEKNRGQLLMTPAPIPKKETRNLSTPDQVVRTVVKERARAAGLDEFEKLSGHSLRAGLATQAALNGENLRDIAKQMENRPPPQPAHSRLSGLLSL